MKLQSRFNALSSPRSLASLKAESKPTCRGTTISGGSCKVSKGLNADGYCHAHLPQSLSQSLKPTAGDKQPTTADLPIEPADINSDSASVRLDEDVEMGVATPPRLAPPCS